MDKKKRILILGYLPPPLGGMESMTKMIINSTYLNNKFDLLFLRLKTRKRSGKRGKFSLLNIAFTIYNLSRFTIILLVKKPRYVYCPIAQNRTGFLRDTLFIFISKILNKKIIVHFHGGAFDLFYKSQETYFKKYILFVLKKIDRLIVLGKTIKTQFASFMEQEKIEVIYNCIDVEKIDFEKNLNKKSDSLNMKVLFLGYISKAKGAADLVKAASLVIKKSENRPIFKLIGPIIEKEYNITFINNPHGAYREISETIKNEGLSNYIKLYTDVTEDFKIRSFFDSDIFTFPSYSEGFALVILEAMAAGLPIIMSRVGGLVDILKEEENCLFIEPGDVVDLSNKIIFLSNNTALRNRMRLNNIKLIKDFFSPERFEKDLEAVLNKVN